MGSSAQNSSGVHWCRRRVRFNEVPEKVPKLPEKVWEALVQSQVRFNRVPEKVPEKVPVKVWEAVVQSQIRFNRVRRRFRWRSGRLWCRPSQVQQGSGEGSGEALGGFGVLYLRLFTSFATRLAHDVRNERRAVAWWVVNGENREPNGPPITPAHPTRSLRSPTSVPLSLRFVPFGHWVVWGGVGKWSQARFNRVPEKVPEKVPGGFGAEPGQVQQGSEKVLEKVWEPLVQPGQVQQGSGSGEGFREGLGGRFWCSQVRFNRVLEKVPALGFAARFRKICNNKKRCGCWGYHRSLFFFPAGHRCFRGKDHWGSAGFDFDHCGGGQLSVMDSFGTKVSWVKHQKMRMCTSCWRTSRIPSL